jgi:diguanylate cyclase (GGDEF)-like protein
MAGLDGATRTISALVLNTAAVNGGPQPEVDCSNRCCATFRSARGGIRKASRNRLQSALLAMDALDHEAGVAHLFGANDEPCGRPRARVPSTTLDAAHVMARPCATALLDQRPGERPAMTFDIPGLRMQPFHTLLANIAALAAILHASFLVLFIWSEVPTLAILNVASVASHVLAFALINRNREFQGFMVIVAEVVMHAMVATYFTGWSSGFHYYFILVVPMIGLSTIRTIRIKAVLVLVAILVYLTFDVRFRHGDNLNVLSIATIDVFYYFNVASVMITLAFIAFCYNHLISRAEDALVAAANTDPLTQLSNRRCFLQSIEKELVRTDRRVGLSFVICDLDHFKSINDRHGHEAGDMVLKAVSGLLSGEIRHCDRLSRWGGEEFLIMLSDVPGPEVLVIAERLRDKVENLAFLYNGEPISLSMTVGVTSLIHQEKPEHAIARADAGLYKGKNLGRNCVVMV